ncbi:MAG TPA: PEGA domain-containing protein [Vulgatibacter sp.]|nr:PEGA domain-containing protein [Vulgatibacter sp.]
MLIPALAAMLLQASAPAPAPAPAETAAETPAQPTDTAAQDAPAADLDPQQEAGTAPAPTAADAAPAKAQEVEPAADAPKPAGKTLWLMQPLYPGQELLVGRTEEAIASLLPADERSLEVVGRKELAASLRPADDAIDCIFGETRCEDPLGALIAGLGFERVVLVRVGQEGTGYRVRAASFQPGSFEAATAESEGANLEKTLLSSVVRVAPLAAQVEVRSEPEGATVFIDGEKVGVTPLSTQVLPGERTIRMEFAAYHPLEKKEQIPVRGRTQVVGALTKLPGKIHVISPGAKILIDGEEVGEDEVEVASTAGTHKITLHRDGYEPYETTLEVKPDDTAKFERELDPTFFKTIGQAMSEAQKEIYEEDGYFAFVYEQKTLANTAFGAKQLSLSSSDLDGMSTQDASVMAFGLEYGSLWKYVGMTWFGASYFTSRDDWTLLKKEFEDGERPDVVTTIDGGNLRLLQPQLRIAIWRFVLGVRGGVGMNLGVATGTERENRNKFFFGGIDAEAMGTVQLRLVGGLFGEAGYGHQWPLVSFVGNSSEASNLRFGVGYAF